MQTSVERRFLDEMLEGKQLDATDLGALIRAPEGIHLDFKDGKLLSGKDAPATLRGHVAGFANADGGLLVIGVGDGGGDSAQRRFTTTARPGGKPLAEWARNVLEPLAGGLSPPPRIQTVNVETGEVLIVGVARAAALVPCIEHGELKYYLRIGDATLAMPPYLISDLLLGRRSHPQLRVRLATDSIRPNGQQAVFFVFEVENDGMVPAKDVTVGIVSWALLPTPTPRCRPASAALPTFIDAPTPAAATTEFGGRMVLSHATSRGTGASPLDLAAFEMGTAFGIETFQSQEVASGSACARRCMFLHTDILRTGINWIGPRKALTPWQLRRSPKS